MGKVKALTVAPVAVPTVLSSDEFGQRNNALRQEQLQRLYNKYPSEPQVVPEASQPVVVPQQESLGGRIKNYIFGPQEQLPPVSQEVAIPRQERFLTPQEELQVRGTGPQIEVLDKKKYFLPPPK